MVKVDKTNWLNVVMHFSDSSLPVGSYAHSFGLEGLCQLGAITDQVSFKMFLERDVFSSLQYVDLPLSLRAYDAVIEGNQEALLYWDMMADSMRPTAQLKSASQRIGRQTWMLYEKTWRAEESELTKKWFKNYHSPIVLGAMMADCIAPREAVLKVIMYQTYSALVQSALKLLPIGPSAAQVLLQGAVQRASTVLPEAERIEDTELGSFNPMWDIAASRHERAEARLFIS